MIKKQNKTIGSCPYYKRVALDRSQQKFHDKYILIGLARNDISGIQVYLHYFCSIYKREYVDNKNKKQLQFTQYASYFFLKFTQIVLLRTLKGDNLQETNMCRNIALDILGLDNKKDKDKTLEYEKLKQGLIKYLQGIYIKNYRKQYKNQSKSYSDQALKIEQWIKNILKEVHQRIDNAAQFKKIINQQILPQTINNKLQIREIKSNFESICNIQILRKSHKQQILQKFCVANKNYLSAAFQILMKSKYQANPNVLILPKFTLETNPVLMKLQTYTHYFSKQKERSKICAEISRDIAKNCLNYHRKTFNFYPYLSLGDIFINQKKIASVLSYRPLILDALGLNGGNIKNFMLKIATEPTPNAINYEKYSKEFDQKSQILLNRKYYQPNYLKDQSHYDIHQSMVKNMKQEDEIVMQKQIAHQVHTWRLINIIYYIHKGRHLGQDFYDGQIDQKQPKQPLYIDKYIQALQRASEQLIKGQLKLSEIIPVCKLDNEPEENQQNSQQFQKNQLNFQYLMRHLNVKDAEDSLFVNLRWEKLRYQIYNRQMLNKSILDLVVNSDYFFKKLPNSKKYFFIYYLNQLESIQQIRLKREKYHSLFEFEDISLLLGRQGQIINQLSKQVNKLSLMRQREKREKAIKDAQSKLIEYSQRRGKVQQYVLSNGRLKNVQKVSQQRQLLQEYRNCQSIIMEFKREKLPELRETLEYIIEKDINKRQLKSQLGSFYNFINRNRFGQNTVIQIEQKLEQIKPIVRNEVQTRLTGIIHLLKTEIQNIVKEIKSQPNCHEFPRLKDVNQKQNQQLNKQLNKYCDCKLELLMLCLLNQKQEYWKQFQQLPNHQVDQNLKKGKILMEDITKEIIMQEKILLYWRQKQQKNLQKQ